MFKIITIGNSGVGKTSIIRRYVFQTYDPQKSSTIGISFAFKNILLKNGIKIKESELLKLLSAEMEKKKNPNAVGSNDIKQKFQKEMEDYLSKTSEYL